MATSFYDDIKSNVNIALPELTNETASSIWLKIVDSIAKVMEILYKELQNSVLIINNNIAQLKYGKPQYYIETLKKFQYGDSLTVDPNTYNYVYETIDTTKQIITAVSFAVSGVDLTIKCAKTVDGEFAKLTNDEYTSFVNYARKTTEIAGLPLIITTNDPDKLSFNITIYYFSSYNENEIKELLTDALATFKTTQIFDNRFYKNDLESYVKTNIPGIRNCTLSSTSANNVPFTDYVDLESGYFDYDTVVKIYYAI